MSPNGHETSVSPTSHVPIQLRSQPSASRRRSRSAASPAYFTNISSTPHTSDPIKAPDDDDAKVDFETAISAFLRLDESAPRSASGPVFQYYLDVKTEVDGDEDFVSIASPEDVWSHVRLGGEVSVQREDAHGDRQVYVSVECECAWEPEHGLQIVFRRGSSVSKVGPFDSHLTNVSAFDRADLADVVYCRLGQWALLMPGLTGSPSPGAQVVGGSGRSRR
ncbi:DUF6985 domain-containing protein [Kitasatospora sp. NPDC096147]|uniref:DUF6985 domain-containing protein n=1 Tax=Kitasatospora sp. NPDC096147 TaxID=3364093 RepID=UPI003828C3D4